MAISEADTSSLRSKVDRYKEILQNTLQYREAWHKSLKKELAAKLKEFAEAAGLTFTIEARDEIQNLGAIVLNLGSEASGLREPVGNGLHRDLIKQNGSLVYQQLFNGKILVLINIPHVEKYGEPQPPKTLAIYRPAELKEAYILQHLETFVSDITVWEDYDDDLPEPNQRIGFKLNFEGKQ